MWFWTQIVFGGLVIQAGLLYSAYAIGYLRGEAQGNANWREINSISSGRKRAS